MLAIATSLAVCKRELGGVGRLRGGCGCLRLFAYEEARAAWRRTTPSWSCSIESAYDRRIKPGVPNASPGTVTTNASSSRYADNSAAELTTRPFGPSGRP